MPNWNRRLAKLEQSVSWEESHFLPPDFFAGFYTVEGKKGQHPLITGVTLQDWHDYVNRAFEALTGGPTTVEISDLERARAALMIRQALAGLSDEGEQDETQTAYLKDRAECKSAKRNQGPPPRVKL